jgi:hypothetical protein
MNPSKAFGWVLLILGIILIGWTLLFSYNIFTGQGAAPAFFESSSQDSSLTKTTGSDIQSQIEKLVGEQLRGLLPINSITNILNLIVWSLLAFILIFGGFQISSLGIKLIK